MKIKTFKDYWETKSLISFRKYVSKYKRASLIEQEFLQNPTNKKWCWYALSGNEKDISLNFITELYNRVDWEQVSLRNDLTEEFIIKFEQKINFYFIPYKDLSLYFIRRYRHLLNWDRLSKRDNLDKEFYIEFQHYM